MQAMISSADGCPLLGLRPTFVSRNPAVVELGKEGESEEGEPTVQLLPRAAGTAWIVATLGALADSMQVEVR